MPVLFFPSNAGFAFPRSYIFGVSIDSNVIAGPTWADNVVDFRDTFPIDLHIVFKENFWEWSSNKWTLGFIFDEPACTAKLNGIEVIYGCEYTVGFNINEHCWRIKMVFGLMPGTEHPHDLPSSPADYWLQLEC